jgi:ABC-type nickel/cobalt efflux system permease component RcnA
VNDSSAWLLVAAVGGVGVLHTMVPDHWAPITMIARQRGWSRTETAWVAFRAGIGHVLSTLAIALVIWLAGVAVATRFAQWVDTIASVALISFGVWIGVSAWRDLHDATPHDHHHRHDHGHAPETASAAQATHGPEHTHEGHVHRHAGGKTKSRTALLLILGSSPMVEGIPAFFAASKYGIGVIAIMSVVFGAATIATYVLLSVGSTIGLQRVNLGPLERYGEVLSGGFIALVGLAFWLWPVL